METSTVPLAEDPTSSLLLTGDNATMAVDTVDIFMEKVGTFMAFKVATYITKCWFPILTPVGIMGNILSFLVLIKPNNRKVYTCIYMAALSINDNILMLIAFDTWLVTSLQLYERHPIGCKTKVFVALMSLQNSTFQVLAMTIDKYIAIKWPHKAATYSTPKKAKNIVMAIWVFVIIYNIPHTFLTGVIERSCIAYSIVGIITKIYSWLTFVINAIIPFTLLIYMNYVIVKTVSGSRKMFVNKDKPTPEEANQDANKQLATRRQNIMKSAESQLTKMLLLVTTLFLILLFPTYARYIYQSFVKRNTPYKYVSSKLFYEISLALYGTNSGINFFLYCISGRKFRNDVKEIICCTGMSSHSSDDNSEDKHKEIQSSITSCERNNP